MRLFHTINSVTAYDKNHKDHATPIRTRLNQRSMRALGQAFDRGIIRAAKK